MRYEFGNNNFYFAFAIVVGVIFGVLLFSSSAVYAGVSNCDDRMDLPDVLTWCTEEEWREIQGRCIFDNVWCPRAQSASISCGWDWQTLVPPVFVERVKRIVGEECNGDTADPEAYLRFTANPPTITRNHSTTLDWEANNIMRCYAFCPVAGDACDPEWLNPPNPQPNPPWHPIFTSARKPTIDNQVVSPDRTTTYGLRCSGDYGTVERTATVRVVPPPRIISFTGVPNPIHPRQRVLLSWRTENVDACWARCRENDGDCGQWDPRDLVDTDTERPVNGTFEVSPGRATNYHLRCYNQAGHPVAMATVRINVFRLWWREVVPVFPFIEEMLGLVLPPRPGAREYQ